MLPSSAECMPTCDSAFGHCMKYFSANTSVQKTFCAPCMQSCYKSCATGATGEQALKATGCSSAISPFSAGASVRASAGSNAGAFLRMYLH